MRNVVCSHDYHRRFLVVHDLGKPCLITGLNPNPYPNPSPSPNPKPKPKPNPNPNPRWGFGEMSQLGHGEADDEPSPRLVSAVRGRVAQAGAGGQHTVMLLKPKE